MRKTQRTNKERTDRAVIFEKKKHFKPGHRVIDINANNIIRNLGVTQPRLTENIIIL